MNTFGRGLIGFTIIGILSSDTIRIGAHRDTDLFSQINPWVTLVISVGIAFWAFSPLKLIKRFRYIFFNGYEIGLDETLWLAFGWWMGLIFRLAFYPQPHQPTGFYRFGDLLIYITMAIFSLSCWLLRDKFQ